MPSSPWTPPPRGMRPFYTPIPFVLIKLPLLELEVVAQAEEERAMDSRQLFPRTTTLKLRGGASIMKRPMPTSLTLKSSGHALVHTDKMSSSKQSMTVQCHPSLQSSDVVHALSRS